MGYTTDFDGQFNLDRPLSSEHWAYLRAFNETRRMVRDEAKAVEFPDPIRQATDLPIGPGGCYFVGGTGLKGQDRDASVLDGNRPPEGQPGLWCGWTPDSEGVALEWDGMEKFYSYVEWLEYMIQHFLAPWGYRLNGKVDWQGEDKADMGTIHVRDNVVKAVAAVVSRPEPEW